MKCSLKFILGGTKYSLQLSKMKINLDFNNHRSDFYIVCQSPSQSHSEFPIKLFDKRPRWDIRDLTPKISRPVVQQPNQNYFRPVSYSPTVPYVAGVVRILIARPLFKPVAQRLCALEIMMYSRAEHVLILRLYFAQKSFAYVR